MNGRFPANKSVLQALPAHKAMSPAPLDNRLFTGPSFLNKSVIRFIYLGNNTCVCSQFLSLYGI